MDPAVFFGRSRVTRQTLKPKQQQPSTNNVDCEVKSDAEKPNVRTRAKERQVKVGLAGKENDASEDNAVKGTKEGSKKTVKKRNVNANQNGGKSKPVVEPKKVQFEEAEEIAPKEAVSAGPVYRNVRRSDVTGDPFNEYDFPVGETSPPPKKKKTRKVNTAKKCEKWYGTVKWEPSKRPIALRPVKKKTVKTQLPGTASVDQEAKAAKVNKAVKTQDIGLPLKGSDQTEARAVKVNKAVKTQDIGLPLKGSDQTEARAIPSKEQSLVNTKSAKAVPHKPTLLSNGTSPNFSIANHFTSTPVARRAIPSNSSRNMAPSIAMGQKNKLLVAESVLPETKRKAVDGLNADLSCSIAESILPPSPSFVGNLPLRTPDTSSKASSSTPRPLNVASGSRDGSVGLLGRISVSVPRISVRESPSFIEREPIPESPKSLFSALPETSSSVGLGATTSTPVTRSKTVANSAALKSTSAAHFDTQQSSPGQVTCSPGYISDTPAKSSLSQEKESFNDTLSGLFDDIPRTSVIPTRMFSTHRGTIFVPNAENVTKRKLPALSPCRRQGASRPTTVRFAPQGSSGLDDCFGFDEEDPSFIPQPVTRPTGIARSVAANAKEARRGKPNLTIQEVQAILRGQSKLASPAIATPRSIQTKLTDFVNSTPTSTSARVVPQPNAVVLTPTPVPLFGEEQLNTDLPSPFLQPSRRSYDRFHPVKRIACGDEVHSGDEEEDTANHIVTESTNPVTKKRKAYKKRKKPADTQLDDWANQLTSHFDEVENVELELQ